MAFDSVTSPRVLYLGFMLAIPALRKDVDVKSNLEDSMRELMVDVALISDSPVVS